MVILFIGTLHSKKNPNLFCSLLNDAKRNKQKQSATFLTKISQPCLYKSADFIHKNSWNCSNNFFKSSNFTRYDHKTALTDKRKIVEKMAESTKQDLNQRKLMLLLSGHLNWLDNSKIRQFTIYYGWVAWTMGQTNRWQSVWCSKYYFFSWFLAKFFAKILLISFLIFFYKITKIKSFECPKSSKSI